MTLKIAVAHHDDFVIKTVTQVISLNAGYTVSWTTCSAVETLQRCRREPPDILLLDLSLKGMEVSRLTCDIMKERPCAILILSDAIEKEAAKVFEAMGCGALDVITTPFLLDNGTVEGGDALIKKLSTIAKFTGVMNQPAQQALRAVTSQSDCLPHLIAIGSSTGGPKALATLLSALPESLDAAILICQHVDLKFAQTLAEWLNSQTAIKVEIARQGMRPKSGVALVAGTNDHLVLTPDMTLNYTPHPRDYPYRPSVNALFESILKYWPRKDLAILLTGMGRDGGEGMSMLRKAGWHTIVQDEKTSIVYGMPAFAVELGAAIEILPLEKIAGAILKKITARKDLQHDGKRTAKP